MNDSFEKFNLRGWEMWQLFPFGLYIHVCWKYLRPKLNHVLPFTLDNHTTELRGDYVVSVSPRTSFLNDFCYGTHKSPGLGSVNQICLFSTCKFYFTYQHYILSFTINLSSVSSIFLSVLGGKKHISCCFIIYIFISLYVSFLHLHTHEWMQQVYSLWLAERDSGNKSKADVVVGKAILGSMCTKKHIKTLQHKIIPITH